jgi:hypothetical protein
MALIIKASDLVRIVRNWPVVVPVPEDGGKISKHEIFVDYEVLPQSELEELEQTARQSGESMDSLLLSRVVKSINGLVDEQNKPIEFNEETLAASKNRGNQRQAMVLAYYDVHAGRKAARKN